MKGKSACGFELQKQHIAFENSTENKIKSNGPLESQVTSNKVFRIRNCTCL